jgi:hypothetical protein
MQMKNIKYLVMLLAGVALLASCTDDNGLSTQNKGKTKPTVTLTAGDLFEAEEEEETVLKYSFTLATSSEAAYYGYALYELEKEEKSGEIIEIAGPNAYEVVVDEASGTSFAGVFAAADGTSKSLDFECEYGVAYRIYASAITATGLLGELVEITIDVPTPTIKVGDDPIVKEVGVEGGEVTLLFEANVPYEVTIPTKAQSWISIVKPSNTRAMVMESQQVKLAVAASTSAARSAVVTIASAKYGLKVEYTISQAGVANPEPEPTSVVEGAYIVSFNDINGDPYQFILYLEQYDDTYYSLTPDATYGWMAWDIVYPVLLGTDDASKSQISFDGTDLFDGEIQTDHAGFGYGYYTYGETDFIAFFGGGENGTEPIVTAYDSEGYLTSISQAFMAIFSQSDGSYVGMFDMMESGTMEYEGAAASTAAAKAAVAPRKSSSVTYVGKKAGIGVLAR